MGIYNNFKTENPVKTVLERNQNIFKTITISENEVIQSQKRTNFIITNYY